MTTKDISTIVDESKFIPVKSVQSVLKYVYGENSKQLNDFNWAYAGKTIDVVHNENKEYIKIEDFYSRLPKQ